MTIQRGQEWGTPYTRPTDLPVLASDAQLAAWNPVDGAVGLSGGDLFRSVGSPTPRIDSVLLTIDRLLVELDGTNVTAVAHVVVRCSANWWGWWRGDLLAICNADFVGTWNVAPRAHPNDGKFDVVEVTGMSLRARWAARQRLTQGTHVPHPSIRVRTATKASWEFARPMRVWIDGVERGPCTRLVVAIEPDALHVVV